MASPQAHLEKAKHNIRTIVLLSGDMTKKDWIVTVAFYAGLHIVDAVLYHTQTNYGKHGGSHDNREKIIKQDSRLKKIWDCYRPLHSNSIIARYLQGYKTPATKAVDFEKVMSDEKLIAFVKERLGGLINSAIKLMPAGQDLGIKETFQTELEDFLGFNNS
ncbi:MAG: hypothetical protein DRP56_07030 [Planctomycetota bacterium]|nr:MAG: hypothetical protein DRP56_07030 [Planctomycetota bacterium]